MGGARGCAGPLDLSIDSAGGATGLATCDTDWDFAYAGDLLGQVDEDGKTLTGTWVVDLWNYTIPIEFSRTVIDGEADLTFSYEDDWVTISEGVMLGDRISP